MVAVVTGIPFALGYYYFRAELKNVDAGLVAVKTLANSVKTPEADKNKLHKRP